MSKSRPNPRVDAFFRRTQQRREEMEELRRIVLDSGLTEELKWGKPCYEFQGGNVVIIQGFKAHCALLFFKGVLMKDPRGVLVKTGENARVGRQIRFKSAREVIQLEPVLKTYIEQAIEIEKSGLKVELEDNEIALPDELQKKLDADHALKTAFAALTPGGKEATFFTFPPPNKLRRGRPGLKNALRKFSRAKD